MTEERDRVANPLIVNEPDPEKIPLNIEVPLFAAKVPPEVPKATARAELTLPVSSRIPEPPLPNVIPPAELPRLLSLLILKTPSPIMVPPVYVLVPERTSVPVPSFVKAVPDQPLVIPVLSFRGTSTVKVGFVSVSLTVKVPEAIETGASHVKINPAT